MKKNIKIGLILGAGALFYVAYKLYKLHPSKSTPSKPSVNEQKERGIISTSITMTQAECEAAGGVFSSGIAGGFSCLGAKYYIKNKL